MTKETEDVLRRLAFLRRTARDMRSSRNLRGAMEVEKIADEIARSLTEGIAPNVRSV